VVRPGPCSANIVLAHAGSPQKYRRAAGAACVAGAGPGRTCTDRTWNGYCGGRRMCADEWYEHSRGRGEEPALPLPPSLTAERPTFCRWSARLY
jgi:hypothetical protein